VTSIDYPLFTGEGLIITVILLTPVIAGIIKEMQGGTSQTTP
jgi:hypothetical protein